MEGANFQTVPSCAPLLQRNGARSWNGHYPFIAFVYLKSGAVRLICDAAIRVMMLLANFRRGNDAFYVLASRRAFVNDAEVWYPT